MKHFFVILGITALVWMGVSMSDTADYPMKVTIVPVGYDTVRYALAEADSVLPVKVTLSGFDAFVGSLLDDRASVEVVLPPKGGSVAVSTLTDRLQQSVRGAKRVVSGVDSVRFVLVPRESRTYRPRIDNVHFDFLEQYGLYGEPRVSPSTVTLYGPAEALEQIDLVSVAPAYVVDINATETFRLPLEPVWQKFPDVHPSCTEVEVTLPVEAYVERDFRVPVQVVGADSTVSFRLYPSEVTVRAWVAQCDLYREPDFVVTVDYDDFFHGDGRLTPQLVRFPDYLRPRNIEPREIQCVVIQ